MKLSRVAEVRSGSMLDLRDSAALFISVSDISLAGLRTSRLTEGALPPKAGPIAALSQGDIVVAMRGASNPAAVVSISDVDRPVFATLDVAVIRSDSSVEPYYLAWFLNLPATQDALSADRSGSTAPRLTLPALKDLEVPLPPIGKQRAIVAVAHEAQRESRLIERLQKARQRLVNELLRRSAEERPVPGRRPARTDHLPQSREAAMRTSSNLDDRKPGKANTSDGRKSGTTHVVSAAYGSWDVKHGSAQRATSRHETKAEAVAAGRIASRAHKKELKIDDVDATIGQSHSHGRDPRIIKG